MIKKLQEKQRKLQLEVIELRKIIKEKNVQVLNDLLHDKEADLIQVSQDLVLLDIEIDEIVRNV